jgi:hypothetical protein
MEVNVAIKVSDMRDGVFVGKIFKKALTLGHIFQCHTGIFVTAGYIATILDDSNGKVGCALLVKANRLVLGAGAGLTACVDLGQEQGHDNEGCRVRGSEFHVGKGWIVAGEVALESLGGAGGEVHFKQAAWFHAS